MSDLERMLAEGPRVAPEPRSAEPLEPGAGQQVARRSEQRPVPSRSYGRVWRLVPAVIFGLFLLTDYLGRGGYAGALLVTLVAVVVLARVVRRLGA